MDNTNKNTVKEDNKCCGKSCTNSGKIILRILYIDKTGLFCVPCAEYLLDKGLAVKEESCKKSNSESENNDLIQKRKETAGQTSSNALEAKLHSHELAQDHSDTISNRDDNDDNIFPEQTLAKYDRRHLQ